MFDKQSKISWHHLRFACVGALALGLSACGGSGGNNGFVNIGAFGGISNSISGVVSKGPVNGAQVCAYSINAGVVVSQIGNCVTSSPSGNYTINLGTYIGPVLLQATHGSYTDEASGLTVNLDTVSPNGGLRSAIANSSGVTNVAITALTEIAYQKADNASGGLTPANITAAINSVQTNFGVTDIVGVMPVDALNLPPNATTDQKIYALALATISQYANSQSITLAAATATLQACLASPSTNCSPGGSTLGALLASAMSTFEGNNTTFSGNTLPVANFGSVTSTGSNVGGNSGGAPLSLLAGVVTGTGSSNGPGAVALFAGPSGTTVDPNGNIYVIDSGNQVIRKITLGGIVSTLAGTPGVTTDVTSCTSSTCGDGTGAQASFNSPQSITYDPVSNLLYVWDCGSNRIRSVTLGGVVATLAGSPGQTNANDGPYGTLQCQDYMTSPITTDGAGNVWIVDYNGRLRMIKPTPGAVTPSNITTVISVGGGDISGLAFDRSTGNPTSGKILMADRYAGGTGAVRMVTLPVIATYPTYDSNTGAVTPASFTTQASIVTYAGSTGTPVITTSFDSANGGNTSLAGITVDNSGNVYVADNGNANPQWSALWKITPAGVAANLVGGFLGSADGPANTASFNQIVGLSTDSTGNIYLAENTNNTVRKVSPTGNVTTLAGVVASGTADGPGSSARFSSQILGLTADASGNLYASDSGNLTIRKINQVGNVSTVAGTPGAYSSNLSCYGVTTDCGDGTGSAASFSYPFGIAFDSHTGNFFVVDGSTIRMITPSGTVSTVAGMAQTGNFQGASLDGQGSAAVFASPYAVATDSAGNVYVTDIVDNVIRKIDTTGYVTTLAGTPNTSGSVDSPTGPASAASFTLPEGIATDNAGNVYVADTGNSTIRKITPAGYVTTLAGSAGNTGHFDGTGPGASFNGPQGLATDSAGNIYVADTGNNAIRKITPTGTVTTVTVQAGSAGGLPVTLNAPTAVVLYGTTLYAVSGGAIVYIANVP